jgi:hypothetical protein
MRIFHAVTASFLIGACASDLQHEGTTVATVDDFVASAELAQTDRIQRITPMHNWNALNDRYVVFHNYDGDYLLHFESRCYDVTQASFQHEKRWAGKSIKLPWTKFFSCQIETIYLLGEGQAAELYTLGDIPPAGTEK